jgi:hypothetical protein
MVVVFPEKGKLKHAIVSSHLGETRDIRLLFPSKYLFLDFVSMVKGNEYR